MNGILESLLEYLRDNWPELLWIAATVGVASYMAGRRAQWRWRNRDFLHRLNVTLTSVEDGTLRIRTILETDWTSSDGKLQAYLQGIYLGQDGHLGWDADVQTRLGVVWKIDEKWSLSAQWIHEFYDYVEEEGGAHVPDDFFVFQVRVVF